MITTAPVQPDLFTAPVVFDGQTFEPERDGARLRAQLDRVSRLMADGAWRTLAQISESTGDPESSVSARLRDLRKPKFGQHVVERRRRSPGTFEYRVAR